jgi:hypothetical protein
MPGENQLDSILKKMKPTLNQGRYMVFVRNGILRGA